MAEKPAIKVEQETSGFSLSEDSRKDTAPSPNVSDFIIKPIVPEGSDMKKVEFESKKKKMKFNGTDGIVLGLPRQNVNARKLAFKDEVKDETKLAFKEEVKNETNSKGLSEIESGCELLTLNLFKVGKEFGRDLTALDFGMDSILREKISGIWSEKAEEIDVKKGKWQQQILELYLKKLELIQEQTQLVLDHLKSSN